ncbi:MAG TPA: hypothetical protein VHS57_00950 [Acidimicrobiales bacterium]|nr:hypothetical protein [Acidimicrobiales bacterium]
MPVIATPAATTDVVVPCSTTAIAPGGPSVLETKSWSADRRDAEGLLEAAATAAGARTAHNMANASVSAAVRALTLE